MAHRNRSLKRLNSTLHSRKSVSNERPTLKSIVCRPSKPDPHRARRGGGGGGRVGDRHRYSSLSLPKRTINYDLAESLMDHSTNPLSSELYKIRFKHSAKQWPAGRFANYREKLDKLDGRIIDITCTRTYPIVPKRKRTVENNAGLTSSIILTDSMAPEQKKILANKQTDFYANLFGCAKVPPFSSTAQTKKTDDTNNSILRSENQLD